MGDVREELNRLADRVDVLLGWHDGSDDAEIKAISEDLRSLAAWGAVPEAKHTEQCCVCGKRFVVREVEMHDDGTSFQDIGEGAELADGRWVCSADHFEDAAGPAEQPARTGIPQPAGEESFQRRVAPWMAECFGHAISSDVRERGERLLEEVLELLQSHGYDPGRVATLRDYVFARPVGEPSQEVGGVMVTLAAYCLATGIDMHAAGEIELARVWTKVDVIRAKQVSKRDIHSPLPSASPAPSQPAGEPFTGERVEQIDGESRIVRRDRGAFVSSVPVPKPAPSEPADGYTYQHEETGRIMHSSVPPREFLPNNPRWCHVNVPAAAVKDCLTTADVEALHPSTLKWLDEHIETVEAMTDDDDREGQRDLIHWQRLQRFARSLSGAQQAAKGGAA